jgi:fructose-bisphosphate aldolase / 6-deoxy-5-ketofructose 1-phosphate synthase
MIKEIEIDVPLDVPGDKAELYKKNMRTVTHGSGRMILFAGDQKIEHLNADYFGEGISPEDADPEHLFKIAANTKITTFASQLELIARYAKDYPHVPYIIKLNSKTNLVTDDDPLSLALVTMEQVKKFREESGLNIVGIGYTVFLGSEHEAEMMAEAGKAVFDAHQQGLLAVLWMYPRGKSITNIHDPKLIAGATGVAASLGADFAKVNYPEVEGSTDSKDRAEAFREAIISAGKTKVVCSGGERVDVAEFLKQLWEQIHISNSAGCAVGRNIHQRSLAEAKKFAAAIAAILYEDASVEEAIKIYNT